jgi:subtilisin family serine protease
VASDTPTIGRIDIYAPGVGIVSTFPARRYARWSGTSMAAPFVAGAIALAFARADASGRPRPGRDQLLAQLRRTGSVAAGQGVAHRLVNPKRMFDA